MSETKNNTAKKYSKVHADSWQNVFTGLGRTAKDKRVNAEIFHQLLTQNELESMYAADPMARKIVDKIPFEGTREWIEFHGNEDLQEKFIAEHDRLKLQKVFFNAWRTARLYGGSIVVMVLDDEQPINWGEPINTGRITNLVRLLVFNRWEAGWTELDTDVNSENFGLPVSYMLTPRRTQAFRNMNFINIHHSRVIRFDGAELPQNLFIQNRSWNDSVLSSIKSVLQSYHQAHDSIAHIMLDFRQGILRMKGLADMVTNKAQADKLVNRIELANMTKSVLNTMLLDLDESYEQNTPTLTGIKDMVKNVDDDLVASVDMPHSIILGDGNKGKMGDTGKQETMDFYDTVTSHQESVLRGPIETVNKILTLSKNGPTNGKEISYKNKDKKFGFDFVPLHNPTEEEEAKTKKSMAEADKIYIEMGVLTPEEVAKSRFAGEKYSIETNLDYERDNGEVSKEEEEDIKRATEDAFYDVYIQDAENISTYKLNQIISKTDTTQSIIISKEVAKNEEQARRLAKKFGAKAGGSIDITSTSYRFRQRDPNRFTYLRSFKPSQEGITIVTGPMKGQ